MLQADPIVIGKGDEQQLLRLQLANRHGLIAGATGTGKTVSLQILAEGFSDRGVPVFMADVKGDLAGISTAGAPNPKLDERAATVGLTDYALRGFPTVFWDLFGEQGHPIRTTVSEMGPLLLARLLGLNETQEGTLNIGFRVADEKGLLLLDLKDLRSLLNFIGEHATELSLQYGRVATASVGAIQRRLLTLEQQGGAHFFGEPALDIKDLMRTDRDGRGIDQPARRRPADDGAQAVRDLPALAAVRAVRGAARGRRSRQAQAGVLLRRGPPAVRRGAARAARQGRAGGPADPLQGRRASTSSRRTRSTSPTTSWGSSATASSTLCAPSRRATRKRCARRRRRSVPTPSSTSRR